MELPPGLANASNTTPLIATDSSDQGRRSRPRRINPVIAPIEDVPGLPRVLLIGDSISMGYTLPVREMLGGEANVHRPPTNCGPTLKGLAEIDKWLGDVPWDVIHFNFGLHDLKFMGPGGENLADPSDPSSRQQVPPDEYRANLKQLVDRLKKTGARLIWRNTTPVPPGADGRVPGDADKYNQIAAEIMEAEQIPIDDQYSYAMKHLESIQKPANVHFTKEGSRQLAEQAVKAIRQALNQ